MIPRVLSCHNELPNDQSNQSHKSYSQDFQNFEFGERFIRIKGEERSDEELELSPLLLDEKNDTTNTVVEGQRSEGKC